MSSPNRNAARKAFLRALVEAKDALNQQILKLRMDMIQYPKVGNVEPEHWTSACKQDHNNNRLTGTVWLSLSRDREACDECSAATASYWNHDGWKKGRGHIIASLQCDIRAYRRARKNYWAAGGHTSWGADRFT